MISIELDKEMPKNCHECPFVCKRNDSDGRMFCPVSRRYDNYVDEYTNRRPWWCVITDFDSLCGRMHFKTQLADGYFHLTADDYWTHKQRENYEKQVKILKKLANNPILDQEVRDAMWLQINYMNLLQAYRDRLKKLEKECKKK